MSKDDIFDGGTLQEVIVTGKAPSWFGKKGLYPTRLRYNPNKWSTARTRQLDYDDLEKGYTAATAGMFPNYLTAARLVVNGDFRSALSTLGMVGETLNDGFVTYSTPGTAFGSGSVNLRPRMKLSQYPRIDYLRSLPKELQIEFLELGGLGSLWLKLIKQDPAKLEDKLAFVERFGDYGEYSSLHQKQIAPPLTPGEHVQVRSDVAPVQLQQTPLAYGSPKVYNDLQPNQVMVPIGEEGLSVRYAEPIIAENPVMNPAERQAALDFLEENPEMRGMIDTKVQPGVGEDWLYPYETMVRHKLRQPSVSTNKYTRTSNVVEQPASTGQAPVMLLPQPAPAVQPAPVQQPVQKPVIKLKENTTGRGAKTRLANLAEDKKNGIGKHKRRNFLQQKALASADGRAANQGRPSEKAINDLYINIRNYPQSFQKAVYKMKTKIAIRADKLGRRIENEKEYYQDPEMKALLWDLLRTWREGLFGSGK